MYQISDKKVSFSRILFASEFIKKIVLVELLLEPVNMYKFVLVKNTLQVAEAKLRIF